MIFVTGGAGFIGANFVLDWLASDGDAEPIVNIDVLTYAGNVDNLASLRGHHGHTLARVDVRDHKVLEDLFYRYRPRAVVHFAAETHVDRSIATPDLFVQHNVVGTASLLDAALTYWRTLKDEARDAFRLLYVSTDEVFGSIPESAEPCAEDSPYAPRNPYAASKAAAGHLVQAYWNTYGLPVITTYCSNNYGPRQFPEKLIPLMVSHALRGLPLPIYGDGLQTRDWLHVSDHCEALRLVLAEGGPGTAYNIASGEERSNLELVVLLCDILERLRPSGARPYRELITHVPDRPGHDRRYAIDTRRIRRELNWKPRQRLDLGLAQTLAWYLDNPRWSERIISGKYKSEEAVEGLRIA